MDNTEEKSILKIICPYCQVTFKKYVEHIKKEGLFTILIKNHSDGENCPPFIAFIDDHGKHRGSQKIDNIEEEDSLNEDLVKGARDKIIQIKESLRFYHLKYPRQTSKRAFEYKVSNVFDRVFMSSKHYTNIVQCLNEDDEENIFGAIAIEKDADFAGGILIYGKYFGMIYTLFWNDQESIKTKTFDDLKGYANLAIEQLIEIYDLADYFF